MTLVRTERPAQGILRLSLTRPGKLNTFDREMCDTLSDELDRALLDTGVRAIILSGSGGHFSAGGDIDWMRSLSADALRAYHRDIVPILRGLAAAAKPTIAVLEGVCAGGAGGFALACDYVVMGEAARFGVPFLRIGLVPDMGVGYLLARRIGYRQTFRLVAESRIVRGAEARTLGLADFVVEDNQVQQRALSLAVELAALPPQAYSRMKALLARTAPDLDAFLADEIEAQSHCLGAPEFVEGCAAFLEKRPAHF